MVRATGCPDRSGVCRRHSKKLRTAFRWRLTQEGQSNWLQRLADENPEEAAFIDVPEAPDEAEHEPWFGLYFRAWERLRFDRFYGAFGGETPISYMAVSRYAADFRIVDDDLDMFVTLIQAIDEEWAAHQAEKAKAAK
ncbi:hypothetical protein OE766_03615 [Pararhizobium sp. YC-54]|uniref:hypothetical protein n=1 Tax=Pararhizobium sp. YC-54 TaxID=2986920 RepID=UPI0021F71D6B|nr:hypothetical protein [Pararhizobium sp. YC-54]MCV9997325.1 hypothetical protein [Pararhizobium sp. YC-54]